MQLPDNVWLIYNFGAGTRAKVHEPSELHKLNVIGTASDLV